MKRFTLLFAVFLFPFLAQSQTPFCGSDWLPADPSMQVLQEQLEQQAFDYFSAFPARSSPTPDAPHAVLTIPVVVHIIHDNGPENISDAQVQQAIAWLNAACANTGYFDQGSGANTGIQFCLAQRTPEGLATTGITRNQSALTNLTIESQDLALKNIHRWAPKQYLNIWLVRAMCSSSAGCTVGAYAYRPSYHGTPFDGLVIEAQYFGGTQSQMSLTAHEIGHYLGLYHTFEGGCGNNDCLLHGDRVCDTPPDQSTAAVPCGQAVNTCSTDAQSGFSTDQPDLTTNYLDYGDINCFHDFTPGQAERMNFYLQGVRHSLLDSKGCLPPCPAPVVSAFTASATTITPGQTVTFTNASQNAAGYQWSVNSTPFSTAANPTYAFTLPGTYTITLLAQTTNAALCAAATSQVVIQVTCAAPVISAFTPSVTSIQPGQTVTFTNSSQNAASYQWSVNGTPFSTAINPDYTFTMPGDYTVTLLAQNSAAFCHMDTSQVIIQVVCAVVADFTVSNIYPAENEPISIINNSQNATIFSWTINGVTQADTLTTLTFTEAGVYAIQLTAGDGLCQSSAQQQVSVQDSCVDKTFQYTLTGDNPLSYWQGLKIASLLDSSLLLVTQALQSSGMPSTVISKFTADGIQLWSKSVVDSLISTSQSLGNSIALAATADGGFMLGVSDVNNISHIAKLSADGEVEWTRGMEGSQTRIYDVQVNADQEILVLAYIKFFNNVLFIKFGSSGQLLWAKPIQSFIFKDYLKIAPLPDGGLIGIGNPTENVGQVIRLDAQGNVVWRKQTWLAGGSQLHNVVVRGEEIFLVGNGYHATIWLLKMNLAGQVLWSKSHFNPNLGIDIQQMIQANDGLILSGVVTQSGAPVRAFLARFDTLGVMQWNRSYLHGFGSVFHDMVVGPRGHYIIGNILSDWDKAAAWLLKTDALGFAGGCLAGSVPLLTADVVAYQNNQAFPGPEAPAIINPSAFALTDFSMTATLLCEKACPKFPEICANNLDDDGDGLFDCLDADCPCMENPCQSKRNDHWYFGTRAGLDFSTEPPTLRSDGQTASLGSTAAISDNQGNLLFYTDGIHIFNRFHQVMPQGINPNPLVIQARIICMIIPYPTNPALYYVFIHDQHK